MALLGKLWKISDRLFGTRLVLRPKRRYMQVAASARLEAPFAVDFLATPQKRIYVRIGERSMLNARILFESADGFVTIGKRTNIGGATIICRQAVTIGNDVMMAWGITIYDHNSNALDWRRRAAMAKHFYETYGGVACYDTLDWTGVAVAPVLIEDKVWIGMDVVILKGVRIGEGAIVGARSVVTRDVAPYTVVAGNPAIFIKRLEP